MSRRVKAKINPATKETWWFNRPVFFGLIFLTFSSLISSCSMMQILAEEKTPESIKIPLASFHEEIGKEWSGEIFLSCSQPDGEDFMRCVRLFYEKDDDGFKWFIAN